MDLIMGMNSGSSFDGIDVILAETEMAEDGFRKHRVLSAEALMNGQRKLLTLFRMHLSTKWIWLD